MTFTAEQDSFTKGYFHPVTDSSKRTLIKIDKTYSLPPGKYHITISAKTETKKECTNPPGYLANAKPKCKEFQAVIIDPRECTVTLKSRRKKKVKIDKTKCG